MKGLFILLLVAIVFTISGWFTSPFYKDKLRTYEEYYNKTEELLDSMCVSDSAFIGLTETNVYSEYLEIRNKIRVE